MKTNRFILAALFISAAFSCQKEGFDKLENNRQTESATINTGNATKTSLNGNEVHWSSDDVIAVFDDAGYKNGFNVTQTQGNYALFSGSVTTGTKQIYAVYPASLATSINGSSINVTIPSDQTSKKNSFEEEHNISVAKAAKTPGVESIGNVTFANVCSYLKFEVPSYIGDVQKVTFTADVPLAGEATINYSLETPVLSVASNGSKSVTMTGNYPTGSEFLFVLAPTTISEFTVTVVTNQLTWTYSKKAQVQFTTGKYKTLGVLPLESITASAEAKHEYSSSTLTGTSVVVNLSTPASVQTYDKLQSVSLEIKNSNKVVVRSISDAQVADTKSVTFEPTEAWPYLPSGDYTVSGTYTLESGAVKSIQTTLTVGKPDFSVTTPSPYTSYTKYLAGMTSEANSCSPMVIYNLNTSSVSISSDILDNKNYSSIKGGFSYKVGENTVTTSTATTTSYGAHNVTALYTFDNVTKSSSEVSCQITGLPYTLNATSNDTVSSWAESGNVNWNENGGVRLGYYQLGGEAYIQKTFSAPANINVVVNSNGIVNGTGSWIKVDNTVSVSVSGSAIFSQTQKGNNEANYSFSNKSAVLSASNATVKCNSSYNLESAKVVVKSLVIKYGNK